MDAVFVAGQPGDDQCIGLHNRGLVRMAGSIVFPVGLFLVVAMGADLVTGNVMYFTTAFLERKYVHRLFVHADA